MAIAKLHIICGNCGSSDDFELLIIRDGDDVTRDEPKFEDAAYLTCRGCLTLHDLKVSALFKGET